MKAGDEIISMQWRKQRAMGRYSYKLPLTHPNHLNKQVNYGLLAIKEGFKTNHLCSSGHILSNQVSLRSPLETGSEALNKNGLV